MHKINLYPWREHQAQERQKLFYKKLATTIFILLSIILFSHYLLHFFLNAYRQELKLLSKRVKLLQNETQGNQVSFNFTTVDLQMLKEFESKRTTIILMLQILFAEADARSICISVLQYKKDHWGLSGHTTARFAAEDYFRQLQNTNLPYAMSLNTLMQNNEEINFTLGTSLPDADEIK